jgi:hypothetical protein
LLDFRAAENKACVSSAKVDKVKKSWRPLDAGEDRREAG